MGASPAVGRAPGNLMGAAPAVGRTRGDLMGAAALAAKGLRGGSAGAAAPLGVAQGSGRTAAGGAIGASSRAWGATAAIASRGSLGGSTDNARKTSIAAYVTYAQRGTATSDGISFFSGPRCLGSKALPHERGAGMLQ